MQFFFSPHLLWKKIKVKSIVHLFLETLYGYGGICIKRYKYSSNSTITIKMTYLHINNITFTCICPVHKSFTLVYKESSNLTLTDAVQSLPLDLFVFVHQSHRLSSLNLGHRRKDVQVLRSPFDITHSITPANTYVLQWAKIQIPFTHLHFLG